jgi:hypothetical protein
MAKTFDRGSPHLLATEKRLMLRRCPHSDCPAALRGAQAYCSIIINTPETERHHGVLCSQCLRLPAAEMAHVWFPHDYARPWCGRYGRNSKDTGARAATAPTYLDPQTSDPGPADPLPDTGARPRHGDPRRPSTRSQKPTRTQLERPLKSQRVLILEVEPDQRGGLVARIEAHGGRIGSNVVASLAAVVTNRPDDPRIVKARSHGVPVHTPEEFLDILDATPE